MQRYIKHLDQRTLILWSWHLAWKPGITADEFHSIWRSSDVRLVRRWHWTVNKRKAGFFGGSAFGKVYASRFFLFRGHFARTAFVLNVSNGSQVEPFWKNSQILHGIFCKSLNCVEVVLLCYGIEISSDQRVEMIYRGRCFLAVLDDSAPRPPPSSPISSASCLFSVFMCVAVRTYWRQGGGGGGQGAKSYDCEKAWSSVNHSILSQIKSYRW